MEFFELIKEIQQRYGFDVGNPLIYVLIHGALFH